jgi:O-antigen/teichoic acid export membrane protein
MLITVCRAGCEALDDFFASSLALFLTGLISLVALIVMQLTHGLTPGSAALAYVSGGGIPCIWLFVRAARRAGGKAKNLLESAKRLLVYGARSYGVDLCGILSLYADQVLVVRLLSPESMGIYVVALSVSRIINVIHTAVTPVLFPKVVGLHEHQLLEVTARAVRTTTILTALFGMLLALSGPTLLPMLYGHDYRKAVPMLNVLIAEAILTGATLVLSQAFMALGRPGLASLLQSSGLALSIPLLLVLVPKFGTFGASLALLCASVVRLTLTILAFPFLLHLPAPQLLPRVSELRDVVQRIIQILQQTLKRRPTEVVAVADVEI